MGKAGRHAEFDAQKRARHVAHVWSEGPTAALRRPLLRAAWPRLAQALDQCAEETGVLDDERARVVCEVCGGLVVRPGGSPAGTPRSCPRGHVNGRA